METEAKIAYELMQIVRKFQLPWKLDELTEGRGNCFPLAIIAQCRRPEIFQDLSKPIQSIVSHGDPTLLRQSVRDFILSTEHKKIQEFKKEYDYVLANMEGRTWRQYWDMMSRNGEWVDQIFVQSTAWYLSHDILVMTPTNTKQDPYFKISGNLYEESIPCPGYALTLGCKTDSHYQSFLPENGRLENARSKKNDRAIYLPKTSDPEAQSKIYEREEWPTLLESNRIKSLPIGNGRFPHELNF